MASDWLETTLGEVILTNHQSYSKNDNWSFINYLDTGNITENNISDIQYLEVGVDKIPSRAKRKVDSGDIIYSTVRPNQKHFGIIRNPLDNMLVSTGFTTIRCKSSEADTNFIYWFLVQPQIIEHLQSIGEQSASAYPSIKPSDIESLDIRLPPIEEQKAIAHILGSLDDKIELNRQMNETLEAMAQALFKSWFVDFDPVIDNALAVGNAIPDELLERAEQRKGIEKKENSDIQKLFPDEFEFTEEMGWIPKGWVVEDISSLCERIQSGGTPRRNIPEYWEYGTIPWLTSGEVRQTIITKVENKISESGLSNSSAKWLTSGATVVAMYGATAGQVAYINEPLTTNQAVCGLIPKKGYQFFNYVTLSRAVAHFEGRATGSAQQNINKGMIESTRVIVPSSISSDSFEEYCEVIFSKWIKNLHENETLAKLRDTLLPKLMSGELRIPDAVAMVDER